MRTPLHTVWDSFSYRNFLCIIDLVDHSNTFIHKLSIVKVFKTLCNNSSLIIHSISIKSSLAADQMRHVVQLNGFCCADSFAGLAAAWGTQAPFTKAFLFEPGENSPCCPFTQETHWTSGCHHSDIQSHGQLQGARTPHSGIVGPLHSPSWDMHHRTSSSPSPVLRKTTAVYLIHLQHI